MFGSTLSGGRGVCAKWLGDLRSFNAQSGIGMRKFQSEQERCHARAGGGGV